MIDTIVPTPTPDPIITPQPILLPPQSNKKYFFLSFFITLFCVSILAIALYLYRQNVSLKSELAAVPTPTPTPAASADPTATWQTVVLDELSISFMLPAEIAEKTFTKESTPSDKGTQTCWTMGTPQGSLFVKPVRAGGAPCALYQITVGQTSFDHEAGRMSGFADYREFAAWPGLSSKYITELTNPNGARIIKIMGADENGFALAGTPGNGVVGALINTSDKKYPVITIQMKLSSTLTEAVFDQILSTFHFLD